MPAMFSVMLNSMIVRLRSLAITGVAGVVAVLLTLGLSGVFSTAHDTGTTVQALPPASQTVPVRMAVRSYEVPSAGRTIVVTVRSGDTLSKFAERYYDNANCWPNVWMKNKAEISNPNTIIPGMRIIIPSKIYKGGCSVATTAISSSQAYPSATTDSYASNSATHVVINPSSGPGGAFGACVVTRESSGRSWIMNSSGHYGLYQFSESTWAAYGGSTAVFGDASVSYQEDIFANALAAGGESNWSLYDGC